MSVTGNRVVVLGETTTEGQERMPGAMRGNMSNTESKAVKFMFEVMHEGRWSADACGYQGPDNVVSYDAGLREIPELAHVLGVSVNDVRLAVWDGKMHGFRA